MIGSFKEVSVNNVRVRWVEALATEGVIKRVFIP